MAVEWAAAVPGQVLPEIGPFSGIEGRAKGGLACLPLYLNFP
jgi:hypothetical protein